MSATETVTQTAATTPAAVEKVETPSPVVEDISNRIFLGNLPPKVSQEDITKFLEDFTVYVQICKISNVNSSLWTRNLSEIVIFQMLAFSPLRL